MEAHFTSTTDVVARIPPSVKTKGFLRDYSVIRVIARNYCIVSSPLFHDFCSLIGKSKISPTTKNIPVQRSANR